MACPFFEPINPVIHREQCGGRLPLIRRYDGFCHAAEERVAVNEEKPLRYCNQGYSRSECGQFPQSESISCFRYTVRAETDQMLQVLYLEERDHTPVRWQIVQFHISDESVRGDLSLSAQAQVKAFSRSYLACGKKEESEKKCEPAVGAL